MSERTGRKLRGKRVRINEDDGLLGGLNPCWVWYMGIVHRTLVIHVYVFLETWQHIHTSHSIGGGNNLHSHRLANDERRSIGAHS